jgi:hypothetical protein
LLLASVLGCEEHPPSPDRARPAPLSSLRPPASSEAPARDAVEKPEIQRPPQLASALVEIHRRLSLAAPSALPRHLAFGSGFLVQLREADIRLINSEDGVEIVTVPLAGPRAAVSLAAGSVLVCGREETLRFDPRQRVPHRFGRISLLPNAILEPSRDSPERVWVIEPLLARAVRYTLREREFEIESTRELPNADGRAATTLLDGSLVYTADRAIGRVQGGAARMFPLPESIGRAWRLVAGERVDQVWLVTNEGEAFLLALDARLRVLRHFTTEGGPFDVGAIPGTLALVSVHEVFPEPRTFVLNLYSSAGKQTKSYILGTVAESDEPEWAARASRDRELAMNTFFRRIAVGGQSSLRLFDLASKDEIVVR